MTAWALLIAVVLADGSMVERAAPIATFPSARECQAAGALAADRLARSSVGIAGIWFRCARGA